MVELSAILESKGHKLKKKTANEYSTSCPWCGGTDRFCIWPNENTYWCRQCNRKGDIIQWFIDMDGMDFKDAAIAAGREDKIKKAESNVTPINKKPPVIKKERKIVARYDYQDYDGNLAFQVVRYDPKDFRQRRPGKQKDWVWNLKGIGLVLYKLQEIRNSNYVFFCEGEKDVDRLMSLGIVATCNPMGAGKIKGQHDNHKILDVLQDRKVYIIPDNDPPGKKHAGEIADMLIDIAAVVKIINLPVEMSGDVSDFINDLGADKAVKTLRDLVTKAKKHEKESEFITVEDLNDIEFPKMSNLIGSGILIDRGQLIIAGEGGVGKSMVRLEMAIHLAMGMDWLGFSIPSAKKVVICQYENGPRTEQSRLRLMMQGKGINRIPKHNLVWMKQSRENRPDLTKIKDVERMIDVLGPQKPDVLIWDCLSNIHSTNENDNVKMRNVLDNISDIATELNHAVVVIHHFGKPAENEQQVRHRFRGASSIMDWATCAFGFTRQKDPERALLKLTNVKMRDAAEILPIIVERDEYFTLKITNESGLVPTKIVLDSIRDAGETLTSGELKNLIVANTGCSMPTAKRAVTEAISNGHIYVKQDRNDKRKRFVRISGNRFNKKYGSRNP